MTTMDAIEIVKWMMSETGTSGVDLSRAIGRTDSFISATLSKGSTPRMDTFSKMANAMGYEIVVRKKSEEIIYTTVGI